MIAVCNIVIIGMVLLIAYWWASQGVFSALLHLVCVIVAGAITLGLWEPVTTSFLLRGGGFDNYAWGISFIFIFAISLFVLRLTMDKLIGANLRLPTWANFAFGFPFGAASGVITIGIFVIGSGFVQSGRDIMGLVGKARSGRTAEVATINTLWLPVHEWTVDFYSNLSVGSLSTNQPLHRYYPDLHHQAVSLIRDSYRDGKAMISMRPQDARVEEIFSATDQNLIVVRVMFESGARDYGEQLTLSSSQIRLIGDGTGTGIPTTAHPKAWVQHSGRHVFDDISHYVTSEAGQQQTSVVFEFNSRELGGQSPAFIQIRGVRYQLPRMQQVTGTDIYTVATSSTSDVTLDQSARSIDGVIQVTNSIRPINASTNLLPAGIEHNKDRYLTGGDGDFDRGRSGITARSLRVQGIYEPDGTRCIQLDVSRGGPADIFGAVADRVGANATLALIDSQGRIYRPVGFIHEKPDNKTRIMLDFSNFVDTLEKLPALPSAGSHSLKLLFHVTVGSTITGFVFGDETVGTCNLEVTNSGRR